jgi:hypothetical protein
VAAAWGTIFAWLFPGLLALCGLDALVSGVFPRRDIPGSVVLGLGRTSCGWPARVIGLVLIAVVPLMLLAGPQVGRALGLRHDLPDVSGEDRLLDEEIARLQKIDLTLEEPRRALDKFYAGLVRLHELQLIPDEEMEKARAWRESTQKESSEIAEKMRRQIDDFRAKQDKRRQDLSAERERLSGQAALYEGLALSAACLLVGFVVNAFAGQRTPTPKPVAP